MKTKILSLRQQTKNQKVIVALSGGVDSTVVAFLLNKAIGKNMVPVFVDTGLLRLNEASRVQKMFAKNLASPLIVINAQKAFLNSLKGVFDPEAKRKCVGKAFLQVFKSVATRFMGIPFLAQGTIYPDVIESGGGKHNKAHVIKSHHNVGGLPKSQFTVLEPLRNLFKDEVRKLGKLLGVPSECVNQHPFPGPGLSVRIIGEVTQTKLAVLRQVDHILISSLKSFDLYDKVSQAAAVLTPVKTVGVQGDQRTYSNLVALRVVKTTDFMTATFANLNHNFLATVATRIVNEVPNVNRVVYDITNKPPGTIEWE